MDGKLIAKAALSIAISASAVAILISGAQPSLASNPSTTSPAYTNLSLVSDAMQSDLLRDDGVIIADIPAPALSSLTSALTTTQATDAARAEFGIAQTIAPSSVSVAQVTTTEYGAVTQTKNGIDIDPAIAKQPMWLVTFDNFPTPVLGPLGYSGPTTTNATFTIFIDAESLKYSYALAY